MSFRENTDQLVDNGKQYDERPLGKYLDRARTFINQSLHGVRTEILHTNSTNITCVVLQY